MELSILALALTLQPWTERQKAALWAEVENGLGLELPPEIQEVLNRLKQQLPQWKSEAQERGAQLLLPGDAGTDRLMAGLPYPVALWVRGSLPPERSVAVVGSREASAIGLERARRWARELTEADVGIVSGLARGIDGAAHRGALDKGATWGILGSGLDHPYPPEHIPLMERMVEAGGGVLTCFPPGAPPRKWHFPRRNLLLAAWTKGTLVMESRQRSGSLVTARLALELGKELWVCPGSPDDPGSEGPNGLLRQCAARVCRSPKDLLEDLG